jgi:hypothetical protein
MERSGKQEEEDPGLARTVPPSCRGPHIVAQQAWGRFFEVQA